MIKRAPRPESDFQLLRNEVARDTRLSYRASGVLADILSRPDNWETSAERLAAARPDKEGRDAIRKALSELEAAGYVKRERVRDAKGHWRTVLTVFDTPQRDICAGRADDGFSVVGKPVVGSPGLTKKTEKNNLEEDGQDSPNARSARVGDLEEDRQAGEWLINKPHRSQVDDENWRDRDRELFVSVIGPYIRSDGSRWSWNGKAGVARTIAFYKSFRKDPDLRKRIRWPGRFVEAIRDQRGEEGLDDWLLDQGLTRVYDLVR